MRVVHFTEQEALGGQLRAKLIELRDGSVGDGLRQRTRVVRVVGE
jgi:hypothetical protein